MKKIVLYVLILVLPAVAVFLALNIAYKQTNHWKAQYYNFDRFNHVPNGIKLCNVGTSHSCWSFKWEDYPELNAFNFAVTNQPFFIDLIMLKHFESKIEKDAIVLIPLSFHQVYKYWEEEYSDFYHIVLNKKEYPLWNRETYIRKQLFPLLEDPNEKLKYIHDDIAKEKIDRFHCEERFTKWLSEEQMKKLVDEHGAQWFLNNFDENAYKKNFDAVCKIVDYCQEHDWKPIFITVPVYNYFFNAFGEIAPYTKKYFYQFSADLTEKYPDIPYWDYSHDEEFSPNIELFMDDDHLNVYGAEKFTARIIQDLRKAGYLE
ncbi:MAG: hypothetical protein GX297_01550 [Treponema sp.]|nr:hypothetical protein [Treponema sp.]